MNVTKYISVDTIFSKLKRDLGLDNISEGDIIEWAGEALEAIGAIPEYEEAVAFIEVKNHQAILPNGLHSIIQIAKNNKAKICPQDIVEDIECEEVCPPSGVPVPLDCKGTPITDYDLAYYRPYFDLAYEYYGWCNHSHYNNQFTPVRLANHTFFNSIVCKEINEDIQHLYNNTEDEYTVIENGLALRFSFLNGQIALSYTRQRVDEETGYPLIPDHFSYTTAITKYITMKVMERYWYNGREGYGDKVAKSEADWQWYCKQAGNLSMMPKGIDQHQNMMEQRQYLLPRVHRYHSFFGNMSRAEQRSYNDPNYRNNHNRSYFRGHR